MDVVEWASGLARRFAGESLRDGLRGAYMATRKRMEPLQLAVHGRFDAAALMRHLDTRIGHDWQVLMVHSSVNHMLPMYTGTPLELVRALMAFVGPERTLAMPAFYFGDPAIGGAGPTLRARPRFDLRRTPSQMGLATELFRRMPGVLSSRHPVYRIAAFGPHAAEMLGGHERAPAPAGLGTPFEYMARHETCVIGVGKPIQVMTQAHHTEDAMGPAFPVPYVEGEPFTVTLVHGDEEIPFQMRGRTYQGRFDIWRLRKLLSPGTLQEWKFHGVPLFAARAGEVSRQLAAQARLGRTLYVPHQR